MLTHWGRVTHICVGNLTIIGSDNGSSPDQRQAIIWTNAGLLLIGPLGTNFSEILIEILTFSLKKNAFESVVCEMATILSRPQCVNQWHVLHASVGRILNSLRPNGAYMHHWAGSLLPQVSVCCLFVNKSLPEPILTYNCLLDHHKPSSETEHK